MIAERNPDDKVIMLKRQFTLEAIMFLDNKYQENNNCIVDAEPYW